MNYCKRCIMPDTRPDQHLNNEGICNACLSFDLQEKVDWDQRKSDLLKIISEKKLDKILYEKNNIIMMKYFIL